ncbi:MAG TPA: hypothetical protein VHM25_08035 [Polyangiaceae bacterium]|nr:hypothetical protein [Polyangiaceae bacterium]
MTATTLQRLSALTLLSCFAVASGAHAEPEGLGRAGQEPPLQNQDVAAPGASPKLVARLALLEAGRRLNRAQSQTDPKAWAAGRAERAAQRRREIAELWGNVVYRIDGQAKLRIHAERMSRLNRMLDLAEHSADQALIARVRTDITRELKRHAQSMQATIAATGGQ